jgi:serine protease Do
MRLTVKIVIVGFIAGFCGAFVFYQYAVKPSLQRVEQEAELQPAHYTSDQNYTHQFSNTSPSSTEPLAGVDFSDAATKATQSVVFINSISQGASVTYWDWFFGEGTAGGRTQVSSGSGVIFSADGYIITNNHVIESAERIEVAYNKRIYPAELIGTNPSTDLAVIKINEKDLPAIALGSSKNLQVGEWVIAVGNPFSLS